MALVLVEFFQDLPVLLFWAKLHGAGEGLHRSKDFFSQSSRNLKVKGNKCYEIGWHCLHIIKRRFICRVCLYRLWMVDSRGAESRLIHCRGESLFCHLWGDACPDISQKSKVCYFHGSDAKWHRIPQPTFTWLHSPLPCEGCLHPHHIWEQLLAFEIFQHTYWLFLEKC